MLLIARSTISVIHHGLCILRLNTIIDLQCWQLTDKDKVHAVFIGSRISNKFNALKDIYFPAEDVIDSDIDSVQHQASHGQRY